MGAHPQDENGSVAPSGKPAKTMLRISLKKLRKAGEQNEETARAREVVSPDQSLGRASNGGDMRAHHVSNGDLADGQDKHQKSQNIVDDTVIDDPKNSETKDVEDNIAEEPPSCAECGKTFPSLKALYGHLRCHPLRGYKGAYRPPEPKNKLQIDPGSSSDKVPASTSKKEEHEGILESNVDPVVNAARILMQMSRSNNPWPTPSLQLETDRLEEYRKGKSILDEEMDEENIKGKGLQLMAAMQSAENVEIKDKCIDVEASRGEEKVKKKKKKRKIKFLESVHEASAPTEGSGYRCNVCSKSFSTHQALGGHRASHNKNKNNLEEVDDEEEGGNLGHAEELVVDLKAATTEHRCTLCQAAFPTGQALGGHKRKHWNPPSPPAPSPPAPPLSESVQKPNRMPLDIDLNEMPKLEAEGL